MQGNYHNIVLQQRYAISGMSEDLLLGESDSIAFDWSLQLGVQELGFMAWGSRIQFGAVGLRQVCEEGGVEKDSSMIRNIHSGTPLRAPIRLLSARGL